MKKVHLLFLSAVLIFACVIICVNAAGGASLNGADSVTAGDTVELILSVSDCPDITSVSVAVNYGSDFELVSATWLKTGAITHYDTNTNKGAVAGLDSPDINGDLFKLVLKAVTPSANPQTVSVTVGAKNGTADVMKATAVKSIAIICQSHIYSDSGDSAYLHTCTVCGYVISGNLNGDEEIDNQDVEYLLWYTLFPEDYDLPVSADYNHDGLTDNQDVEYLLWHTLFPEDYPIE